MINLFKKLLNSDDNQEEKLEENQIEVTQDLDSEYRNDEELIAVIAATVAVAMGVGIPEVNIKTIRRIPQNTTAWADMGRKEQIFSRLN